MNDQQLSEAFHDYRRGQLSPQEAEAFLRHWRRLPNRVDWMTEQLREQAELQRLKELVARQRTVSVGHPSVFVEATGPLHFLPASVRPRPQYAAASGRTGDWQCIATGENTQGQFPLRVHLYQSRYMEVCAGLAVRVAGEDRPRLPELRAELEGTEAELEGTEADDLEHDTVGLSGLVPVVFGGDRNGKHQLSDDWMGDLRTAVTAWGNEVVWAEINFGKIRQLEKFAELTVTIISRDETDDDRTLKTEVSCPIDAEPRAQPDRGREFTEAEQRVYDACEKHVPYLIARAQRLIKRWNLQPITREELVDETRARVLRKPDQFPADDEEQLKLLRNRLKSIARDYRRHQNAKKRTVQLGEEGLDLPKLVAQAKSLIKKRHLAVSPNALALETLAKAVFSPCRQQFTEEKKLEELLESAADEYFRKQKIEQGTDQIDEKELVVRKLIDGATSLIEQKHLHTTTPEDLVLKTLAKALQEPTFPNQIEQQQTFLAGLLESTATEQRKASQTGENGSRRRPVQFGLVDADGERQEVDHEDPRGKSPEVQAMENEFQADICHARNALSDEERELLDRRDRQAQTYDQIAEETGLSRETVRYRLDRARGKLANDLKRYDPDNLELT